ncbi:MAG: type II toxin-antitoxin system VapC family toxin [Reyranellaceae bacterium]
MIAVDTSALMAIILNEPQAEACVAAIESEEELLISAATIAESLIVAARRGLGEEMERLIDGLNFNIVSVTAASAGRTARAYRRWGKGVHAAGLNVGDCFAYEVAMDHRCRLLFVGDDFARTDVENAIEGR